MIYRLNTTITPLGHFRRNKVGYDPTTVTLTIRKPRSADVVKAKADLLNDSVGDYALDLELNERGTWRLAWVGTGTYVDAQSRIRPYHEAFTQVIRVYQ